MIPEPPGARRTLLQTESFAGSPSTNSQQAAASFLGKAWKAECTRGSRDQTQQQGIKYYAGGESLFLILCAQSKEASCNQGEKRGAPLVQTLPSGPGPTPSHIGQWPHQVRAGGGFSASPSSPSGLLEPFPQSPGRTGLSPLLERTHTAETQHLSGWRCLCILHSSLSPPALSLHHPHRGANPPWHHTPLSHTFSPVLTLRQVCTYVPDVSFHRWTVNSTRAEARSAFARHFYPPVANAQVACNKNPWSEEIIHWPRSALPKLRLKEMFTHTQKTKVWETLFILASQYTLTQYFQTLRSSARRKKTC